MTPRQVAVLGLSALCWGSAYIFMASALDGFPPMMVVLSRCVIASLALAVYLRVRGERFGDIARAVRARPVPAVLLALTGGIIPYILIGTAQQEVPAGLTGVLMGSVPIWTALLAIRLDHEERIDRRQAVGLLIGFVGVGLVVGVGAVTTVTEALAVAAILISAACYAMQNFVVKAHYQDTSPASRGFTMLVITAVVSVPFGAAAAPDTELGIGPVLNLLGLALVGTTLGLVLILKLVSDLGPQRASLVTYLAPGVALVLAAIFLGEPITVPAVAGLALIMVGVVVGSRRAAAEDVEALGGSEHVAPADATRVPETSRSSNAQCEGSVPVARSARVKRPASSASSRAVASGSSDAAA